MKKITVYFLVLLGLMSLGLTLVPSAFSQTQNIKIVSYSYYLDAAGFLVVVGEVQNVGPNTVTAVTLTGSAHSLDGADQADSYTIAGIDPTPVGYLNPQQKAPFYMDFYTPNASPDGKWQTVGISNITLEVAQANATTNYQYPDLKISSSSDSIGSGSDDKGVYWVNGNIENTGSQTAQDITIFGTFYNATGNVVAVGYSDQIGSIASSKSTTFKLGAFDLNQTKVPSSQKISTYSLLINAQKPTLQGTAPIITPYPTSEGSQTQTSSPTDSQSSSSSPSDSTGTNNSTNSLDPLLIAIIVVVGILITAGAVVALKKRKPQKTTKETIKARRKSQD